MKTLERVYSRGLGSYSIPENMQAILGFRELEILNSKDCCHFPHVLNKDCEFYISDDCIEYYSPKHGSFTYQYTTNKIVG